MEKIKYSIQFLSDWNCSSGLTTGAAADSETLKDRDGFPYLPGKTMKGLLRYALLESGNVDQEFIDNLFGKEHKKSEEDGLDLPINTTRGKIRVGNVMLSENERGQISKEASKQLFRRIASTKIDERTGVAEEKSLRTVEVCMPIEIEGEIECKDESDRRILEKGLRLIRAIGTGRNRGFGRCEIKIN